MLGTENGYSIECMGFSTKAIIRIYPNMASNLKNLDLSSAVRISDVPFPSMNECHVFMANFLGASKNRPLSLVIQDSEHFFIKNLK